MAAATSTLYIESLQTELKEFFVRIPKCDMDLTQEQEAEMQLRYYSYIREGRMYSNKKILNTLKKDFAKYLPKYISSWNHEELEFDFGEIIFGVNDDGEITGIPFTNTMDYHTLHSMIIDSIKDNVECQLMDELIDGIQVELVKINKEDFKPHTDLDEECEHQLERQKQSIIDNQITMEKYDLWRSESRKWVCKLSDYINVFEKRHKFLEWAKEKCTAKNRVKIIQEIIEHPPITKFSICINEEKQKESSMIYWLCIFKDEMALQRPPRPKITPIYQIDWRKIYYSPRWMTKKFIDTFEDETTDTEINIYIIKIKVPNLKVPVYATHHDKYRQYYRTYRKIGPASIPLGI